MYGREGELVRTILVCGKSADPQDCLCKVVRPVPQSWTHHSIVRIETCVKGEDDLAVGGGYVDSAYEPRNGSSKWDGGIERLRIGDVLEDPRYTPGVVHIFLLNYDQLVRCGLGERGVV